MIAQSAAPRGGTRGQRLIDGKRIAYHAARELRRQRDRAELERRWREFMARGSEA